MSVCVCVAGNNKMFTCIVYKQGVIVCAAAASIVGVCFDWQLHLALDFVDNIHCLLVTHCDVSRIVPHSRELAVNGANT